MIAAEVRPAPTRCSPGLVPHSSRFSRTLSIGRETTSGGHLLVGPRSNHLGTTQVDLPAGSRLSLMRPGKDVRLRSAREGRGLPKETAYRVITFTKDDKVVHLSTSLLDTEQYPANELIALYRQRWEIELAFDKIKNHLGSGGPL